MGLLEWSILCRKKWCHQVEILLRVCQGACWGSGTSVGKSNHGLHQSNRTHSDSDTPPAIGDRTQPFCSPALSEKKPGCHWLQLGTREIPRILYLSSLVLSEWPRIIVASVAPTPTYSFCLSKSGLIVCSVVQDVISPASHRCSSDRG